MKTCSAPIFVFRWKPETGKAPGKQRKTRSFPQKRAQINRPWGDPSAKCGKLFCFFVSGRHFLGRTGLQSAVFPLHPVLFQVEGNSKKEQFCADVCPASREESPESEIIFQQGKSALRLNGAADRYPSRRSCAARSSHASPRRFSASKALSAVPDFWRGSTGFGRDSRRSFHTDTKRWTQAVRLFPPCVPGITAASFPVRR